MMQPTDPTELNDYWRETIEQMNDQLSTAIEQNVDAQSAFIDTWFDSLNTATDEADVSELMDGYRRAYEIWMAAAEESTEFLNDVSAGEDVPVTEFRDTWLNAANESFKELMGTGAFAAATGRAVEDLLNVRQQTDEITEETLHDFGISTKGDIQEIGDRLVELERRQHAVESKLDSILDKLDE